MTSIPRAATACALLAASALCPLHAQSMGSAREGAWPGPLNDSGLTSCLYDDLSTGTVCGATGQDAAFGRDVTDPDDADGRVGFSFVKVGPQFTRLPATATSWPCLLDAVTGLLWEVKTTDGGLQDASLRYTNFGDLRVGDASSYVAAVNAQGLCGQSDWRLPTRNELQGIMDYGRDKGTATADTRWLGATATTWTWVSNNYVGGTGASWKLDFSVGHVYFAKRKERNAVRLVRGTPAPAAPQFSAVDAEVLDVNTGLIWARCTEGQSWSGSTCTGPFSTYNWKKAVAHAKEVAASTGVAWRLPNPKELGSLVDATRFSPTIDPDAFPNTPATWYWSSAYDSGGTKTAFFANFFHGGIYDHDRNRAYATRLVRTAP